MNTVSNPKFLYSSIYSFTNDQTMDFFEENGCPLKVERGNRVFPQSDKSSDIIRALEHALKLQNVTIIKNTKVDDIIMTNNKIKGIKIKGKIIYSDAVIVATGGLSYPSTGSTGDGYEFAKKVEHNITKLTPSLVSLRTKEGFVKQLQGLSLRNVQIKFYYKDKVAVKLFFQRQVSNGHQKQVHPMRYFGFLT